MGKKQPKSFAATATEHEIQSAFFQWVHLYEERHPQLKLIFAIPNGEHRSTSVARRLKKEGVRAGVWDVLVAVPSYPYHGLFIEFKSHKGRLEQNQIEFMKEANANNYLTQVYSDWTEAANYVADYLDLPVTVRIH